jgi:DNA-binding transcriptional ArsR family regulator/uncharacterized protein YndB with AHSA1/START domain
VPTTFAALAEPNRRRILDLLADAERPVGELVGALGVSQPAVSKHLRVLREAGLVEVRGDAQRRLYRVRAQPLRDLDEWLRPYRRLWASSLDALDAHLATIERDREDDGGGIGHRRTASGAVVGPPEWSPVRPSTDRSLAGPSATTERNAANDRPLPRGERQMTDLDEYGTLERRGDGAVLSFRRRFAHPQAQVWRALTEPEQLERWFPTTINGERAAGARLSFAHRDIALPPFDGEMLAFEPPRLMELRWGEDVLRFELAPDGPAGTLLTFTDTIEQVGKAARDGAGWHACLGSLADFLDNAGGGPSPGERWGVVHDAYVERFGAEAATIGPPREFEDAQRGAAG